MNVKRLLLIAISVLLCLAGNSYTTTTIWYSYDETALTATVVPIRMNYSEDYDPPEYSGDIVIPATTTKNGQTYTVVAIADGAFAVGDDPYESYGGMSSVTIPSTVTSIGNRAFYRCSNLTSVTMADGVESIGEDAFRYCSSLTSLTIPKSVTSIGERAFSACRDLASIVVEKGNKVYDSRNDCNAIIKTADNELVRGCKNTIIPNSVTSLGLAAFAGSRGFSSINIPNSVTSIGGEAFMYCKDLSSVNIPSSVTYIGEKAFYYCEKLTNVYYYVEEMVSYTCPFPLKKVTLHVHDKLINDFKTAWPGFANYKGLDNVDYKLTYYVDGEVYKTVYYKTDDVIRPEISPIKKGYDFNGWNGLPQTMPSKDVDVIAIFGGLTKREIDKIVYQVTDADESLVVITGNRNASGAVRIPASVNIDGYDFTVTSVKENVFKNNEAITSLVIPSSVTKIGDYAFYGCSKIEKIEIGNGINEIGERAFAGIDKMTDFTCLAANVPTTDRTAFENSYLDYVTLHVPEASVDEYKAVGPWSGFKEIVGIRGGENAYVVEVVKDGLYFYIDETTMTATVTHPSLEIESRKYKGDVEIPKTIIHNRQTYNITSIGDSAFFESRSLSSVTIPNGVKTIGEDAFRYCSALTSVTIPSSVTFIGKRAFSACSDLASIVVEEGNKVYDSRGNCNAIIKTADNELVRGCKNTVVPSSVTSFGFASFAGSRGFSSISIPNSITFIGGEAFLYCRDLSSVSIPNSVVSIGDSAFMYCSGMTSVTIPSSITSIKSNVFRGCSSLRDIYCYVEEKAYNTFPFSNDIKLENATLHVHDDLINDFKTAWPGFGIYKGLDNIDFKLTYFVDGEVYKTVNYKYGDVISPEKPVKKGYEFSQWNGLPQTMPANNVEVEAIFGGLAKREVDNIIYQVTDADESLVVITGNKNASGAVRIPASVNIDGYEFTVTSVEENVFKNNENITSLVIPSGVTKIGDYAFYGCSKIEKVEIGNGIIEIGERAFAGIDKMTDFTCLASFVPTTDRTAFENSYLDYVTLYVPEASVDEYKAVGPWSGFKEIVGISGGETAVIDTHETGSDRILPDGWYTTDGMKLSAKPDDNGLYINNGKKIIIK